VKSGAEQCGKRPTILFAQYSNPDFYPTTYNVARMLAGDGYEIAICCRADRPANIDDYGEHVSVHRIGKLRSGLLAPVEFAIFLLACFFVALRGRPSLLIGYDLHGLIAAGVIGRLLRRPFFYHVYDVFLPEEGMGKFDCILKRYERGLSSRAAALIVSSDSKAQLFLRTANLDRSVFVVANSPPLQERAESGLLTRRLSERGFEAAYIVYYHGSIGPGKGLLPVVRSIPYWPKGVAFVLLGVIYEQSFFDELMRVASGLGVQDRIHYLGVVPFPKLYDYTRSADLGLFVPESTASIHLYSGTAIVKLNDYMACGVPFLVSGMDALSALACETGAGFVGDIGDPRQLGYTISAFLKDGAARQQMGERGYQLHRDKFNLATQYEPVLQVIRQICEPGTGTVTR
jgi:glycosyltransferase involved in cell wall biosynthesis